MNLQEQREKFEKAFKELIAKAPIEIQEKWSGNFYWHPTNNSLEPMIRDFVKPLPQDLQNEYENIVHKFKDGLL